MKAQIIILESELNIIARTVVSCPMVLVGRMILGLGVSGFSQATTINIGDNIGDVEKILTDLTVSRSQINTQMTPVAVHENYLYTANIEHGLDGDIDGVGLHTVVRQGFQRQDGTWQWDSVVIEDRTVFDEYHTAPSVGVDEDGMVHAVYNMHNIPWQYKRMTVKHDLSSFIFFGQAVTLGEIERWKFENRTTYPTLGTADIPGNQITYPHFARNALGQLFVTYRFASRPKSAWSERTLGVGIAKYDTATETWSSIGSPLTVTSEDFDPDPEAPSQPIPFAAEQGWTTYAPRLMFGPQNQLHTLMFWREGTPGATISRPCHVYSNDGRAFFTLDGESEVLPLTPDRCGNTGFVDSQQFYTLLDTAMDSQGNPYHLVSPDGSSRKLVTFNQTTQSWVQENSPGNATEIFFDASDHLWAVANGPVVYRRDTGLTSWVTQYSDANADNCYPKATLSDDKVTAIIHTQSCDQTSVTLYGVRIGLSVDEPDFAPELITPVPGSTLNDSTETFVWNSEFSDHWLYVGSTPGGQQYHSSGALGTLTTQVVRGLATEGAALYARLFYRNGPLESWEFVDESYTAATNAFDPPQIVEPADGELLSSTTQEFFWTHLADDIEEWWLYVGSAIGARNYYDSQSLPNSDLRRLTVSGLPSGNVPVHVRLWFRRSGFGWDSVDHVYVAASEGDDAPEILSPLADSTLASTTQEFSWSANGTGINQWWLYIGTERGGKDLFDSGSLTNLASGPVSGLPANGADIHARLWFRPFGGAWSFTDTVYSASGTVMPEIVSPASGSSLSASSIEFSWHSNGLAVDEWWLYAGSTLSGTEYFNSGSLGNADMVNVINLPTDGSVIYITLWFRQSSGAWYSRRHIYNP